MKPRIIIIIVIAIIVCGGAAAYLYLSSLGHNSSSLTNNVSPVSGGNEVVLSASQVLTNIPTSTFLTIGTPNGSVQVNNFYLSNPLVTDGGESIILASTTEYLVIYSTIDSSFWIGVDPAQFQTVRSSAEQALLSVLGVSSTIACKLNISVATFYSATSSLNNQSFPPSFCADLNPI